MSHEPAIVCAAHLRFQPCRRGTVEHPCEPTSDPGFVETTRRYQSGDPSVSLPPVQVMPRAALDQLADDLEGLADRSHHDPSRSDALREAAVMVRELLTTDDRRTRR